MLLKKNHFTDTIFIFLVDLYQRAWCIFLLENIFIYFHTLSASFDEFYNCDKIKRILECVPEKSDIYKELNLLDCSVKNEILMHVLLN